MRTIHKGSLAGLAAVAGSTVALVSTASPAFAGTFTQPTSNPFTVPVTQTAGSAGPAGTPITFPVAGTGYTTNSQVFIEICDGTDPTTPGWDPNVNCDLATSPAPSTANATGGVSWPATNAGNSIVDFRGQSPQQVFNCVAQEDVPNGTPQNPDGSFTLTADTTVNGEPLAPGVESWTNCQLRMSTSDQIVTADQAFIHLTIPNTPAGVPESSFAVLLPIGAAGLLAAGVIITRRRRSTRMAA